MRTTSFEGDLKVPASSTNLPSSFLTCFEVLMPQNLVWPVRLYRVRKVETKDQAHVDRGAAKQAIWGLRKANSSRCRGYGFVVDISEDTIAIPEAWDLPSGNVVDGYEVKYLQSMRTDSYDRASRPIIGGILREAVKASLKSCKSAALGPLWQDYNRFCQMPDLSSDRPFHFCRKFGASLKVLHGNKWVLQVHVSTGTLDGRTFSDYYIDGKAELLADMIDAKRFPHLNRSNRPATVRVFHSPQLHGTTSGKVLDLCDIEEVSGHAMLSRKEQSEIAREPIYCKAFNRPAIPVDSSTIRLVLDTQITKSDHSETIIEPEERFQLSQTIRDVLNGMEASGKVIEFNELPVDSSKYVSFSVPFPALRVRNGEFGERTIRGVGKPTSQNLHKRGRERSTAIKQGGFLQSRPINPLVACSYRFGQKRLTRLKKDLNHLLSAMGVDYSFESFMFSDVDELRRHIETNGFDSLFAVLPEGSRSQQGDDNTHEQIKQRIEVPSQCIHYDRTLPERWVDRSPREFKKAEARISRRIEQTYQLCLWNLLVKHHWIPFAPAESFSYNVHFGLDVGGRHNNRVMSCLGYGFSDPTKGLIFRPEEIPVDVQKAEPIPTGSLYKGLLRSVQEIHRDLRETGVVPDFEKVLFFRDGMLLGDGDNWNEIDAIRRLHNELRRLNWISDAAIWTAVEIMKNAEDWRILRSDNGIDNPLVGSCFFPFEDEHSGIVCTTGVPYLTQGTASPTKFLIRDIHGRSSREEVVKDLVWEADMCFTKPDTGMSLPWVLHVADTGALQLAKSYKITGITT